MRAFAAEYVATSLHFVGKSARFAYIRGASTLQCVCVCVFVSSTFLRTGHTLVKIKNVKKM